MSVFITAKEAAKRAGVSIPTIHRWMNKGLFSYKRKNMHERAINEAEFDSFLAEFTAPINHSIA